MVGWRDWPANRRFMGSMSCVRLAALADGYGDFALSGRGTGRYGARGFALGIALEDEASGFRRFRSASQRSVNEKDGPQERQEKERKGFRHRVQCRRAGRVHATDAAPRSLGGVGSPREIAPPRLPRIRTCGLPASGSSVYGLAARYTL